MNRNKKELYSTHIFMLPFIFSEDVETVNDALTKSGLWHYETFKVDEKSENYNEYIYFYEHVRKTLYSTEEMSHKQATYYFEYRQQEGQYILELTDRTYRLDVVGISMRTFETGVGVLTLELENRYYFQAEDVLKINDFGRRLFPQFLTEKASGFSLDEVKKYLLPSRVGLVLNEDIDAFEDFSYYEENGNVAQDVTNLPNYIHALLGQVFSSHKASGKETRKSIHIEPIIDDRMFVLSMYMNDALSDKMKVYEAESYAYEEDPLWYRYTFVDGGSKTCQSKHMTKKLIEETSYDRWVEWGTLFGISRYSFVALTGSWYGKNRLEPHMRTMYFQMFTLLLSYRASILNFSNRVAALTLKDDEKFNLKSLQVEVSEIYKDYINFQNTLLFREVTAQEQGIEIYNQALSVMQIDKQVKDLDTEIAELHIYVSMKAEELRNQRLETISELGAVFLPPALLTGVLGINSATFDHGTLALTLSITAIIFSAVFGYVLLKVKEPVGKALAALLLFLTIFGTPKYLEDTTVKKSDPVENRVQTSKVSLKEMSIHTKKGERKNENNQSS